MANRDERRERRNRMRRTRDDNYDPQFEKKLRKFLKDSAEKIATLKRRGDRKR